MPFNFENIPFLNLQEQSHFLIRPLLPTVNPAELKEAAHRHSYQEILWICNGEWQHTIDDQLFTLEPNTFYLIFQGQIHHFIKGENLKGFLIRFNNEFLNEISPLDPFTPPYVNKITVQNENDIGYFNYLIHSIYVEFTAENSNKEAIIRHLLMAFLYKLSQKKQAIQIQLTQKSSLEDQIYIRFSNILESEYSKNVDTAQYVTSLGITTRQLCSIIKKYSGKTTKQLIIERRILEAKRLLDYTQTPLKEIAYQLGFEDIGYFCRSFKIQTGLTPSQFKSKI